MMQPSSPSVSRPLALVAGLLLLLLVPEGSAFRGGPITGSHRQQARQQRQAACRMMAAQQQQQPKGQESRLGALKRGALAAQVCKGRGERDFFLSVLGG